MRLATALLVAFSAAPGAIFHLFPVPQPLMAQKATTIGGTWIATSGAKRTFRGTWSAQSLPAAPNTATGSWTMVSAANQTMMEGTWSAQKSDAGWQGTWAARVTTGRLRSGRVFSGTWQATLPAFDGRSLTEMLLRTVEAQVSGSWRSLGLSGSWSLRASQSPPAET